MQQKSAIKDAKQLIDVLRAADLTATEFRLALVFLQFTVLNFGKSFGRSTGDLAEMARIPYAHLSEVFSSLIQKVPQFRRSKGELPLYSNADVSPGFSHQRDWLVTCEISPLSEKKVSVNGDSPLQQLVKSFDDEDEARSQEIPSGWDLWSQAAELTLKSKPHRSMQGPDTLQQLEALCKSFDTVLLREAMCDFLRNPEVKVKCLSTFVKGNWFETSIQRARATALARRIEQPRTLLSAEILEAQRKRREQREDWARRQSVSNEPVQISALVPPLEPEV